MNPTPDATRNAYAQQLRVLTARQRKIIATLIPGATQRECAEQLGIGRSTIIKELRDAQDITGMSWVQIAVTMGKAGLV